MQFGILKYANLQAIKLKIKKDLIFPSRKQKWILKKYIFRKKINIVKCL